MTRRAPRATLNAIVVALVLLVLACAVLAAPGNAASDPHKPAREHAAKRHIVKRVSRGLRAVIGHALEFETWRSLVRRQGLSRRQAVDAMVRLATGV